ncbi:PDGLE domain-containing protein [Microbacterium lacus]|uniref:PDGLE domain-containing protein n=1 Tax=Microbacterium lacus TaxID=415217 RepID=UPI00384F4050
MSASRRRTFIPHRMSTKFFTVGALATALFIACVLSVWASSNPDGLEFVAESTGFIGSAEDSATAGSPLADYGVSFVDNPWLQLVIAGTIGCAVTFGLAWLVGRAASRRAAQD